MFRSKVKAVKVRDTTRSVNTLPHTTAVWKMVHDGRSYHWHHDYMRTNPSPMAQCCGTVLNAALNPRALGAGSRKLYTSQ